MTSADQEGWNARKQFLHRPDGRKIAFVDNAVDAPALLLVHGYTDSSRSWSLIEPLLPGLRLVMPDLPGHGQSPPSTPPSLQGFADDLAALMASLGIGRYAVAGHSMGAMTAIALAGRDTCAVEAVVSLSGSLRPDLADGGALARAIGGLRDPIDAATDLPRDWHHCSRPVDADFLRHIAREAAAMPAEVWRSLFAMLQSTDLSAASQAVRAPVLLLGGTDDALFDDAHRAALAAAFPAADSHVLDGRGHNPHWESPAAIAGLMLRFLVAGGCVPPNAG
ncbi:pimeloyl-ACP methyl ester carboxylesterase [Rhizobium subbaraonis]|uniref:Pimeloyl-ACP methyl ester carboxylesterase n=1 Tax=Rhizobium subbaraonis TaxID=908946 RepID=A0A285U0J9_9HYPH|nr:alpha/beta hydrolase [Rhizobium subbaraonis]SOC35454.1 pimeloyl-ACP methyl ester carboxylesterase [Rhizobium subbaraonis]